MSLKVNTISTSSGNNIAMQVPLNLKSYNTTERNALTSSAGDVIYNTTDSKVQFYDGTSWNDL